MSCEWESEMFPTSQPGQHMPLAVSGREGWGGEEGGRGRERGRGGRGERGRGEGGRGLRAGSGRVGDAE